MILDDFGIFCFRLKSHDRQIMNHRENGALGMVP